MLVTLVTVLHVIICLFLIIVVLLQHGKSADIAGAFGGMGSQTAFGPRGAASALSRATTVAVILFMVTSLALTVMTKRTSGMGGSVLEGEKPSQTQGQPAQPKPAEPTPVAPQPQK